MWPTTKPPVGAKIDCSNTLGHGLINCWLFQDNANDLLGNRNGTLIGGSTIGFNGLVQTSTTLQYCDIPEPQDIIKEGTIFISATPTAAGSGDQMVYSSATNRRYFWLHDGMTTMAFRIGNGGEYGSSFALTNNTKFSVGMKWTNNATEATFFGNGKALSSGFGGSNTSNFTNTSIGSYMDGTWSFKGTIHVCMIYNRSLSDTEVQQLHELTKGW